MEIGVLPEKLVTFSFLNLRIMWKQGFAFTNERKDGDNS